MTTIASQITSLTVVYSTVYSDAKQRKHQSSASLAFVWGIHRDRWIPRTKGQLRGKCFHLMTSSWCEGAIGQYSPSYWFIPLMARVVNHIAWIFRVELQGISSYTARTGSCLLDEPGVVFTGVPHVLTVHANNVLTIAGTGQELANEITTCKCFMVQSPQAIQHRKLAEHVAVVPENLCSSTNLRALVKLSNR